MERSERVSSLLSSDSLDVQELESMESGSDQVSDDQVAQSIETVYAPISGTAVDDGQGYRHIYVTVQTPSDLAALTQSLGGQQALNQSNFVTVAVPQRHYGQQQLTFTDTGQLVFQTQDVTDVTSDDPTEKTSQGQILVQRVLTPGDGTEGSQHSQILLQQVIPDSEQKDKPQEAQILVQQVVTPSEQTGKPQQSEILLQEVLGSEHPGDPSCELPGEDHDQDLSSPITDKDNNGTKAMSLSIMKHNQQAIEEELVRCPEECVALGPVDSLGQTDSHSDAAWPIVTTTLDQLITDSALPLQVPAVDASIKLSAQPPGSAVGKTPREGKSWQSVPQLTCHCEAHRNTAPTQKPIFSWVQVGLPQALTNAIPGCSEVFLRQFAQNHNLSLEDDQDKKQKKVTGSLNKILCLHDNLSHLMCGESVNTCQSQSLGTRTSQPGKAASMEKGILCDLLRPQFSRSGREIKRKLLDLPEYDDTVNLESRNRAASQRSRGGKRRRGRPPKYAHISQQLDDTNVKEEVLLDNSKSGEADRLVAMRQSVSLNAIKSEACNITTAEVAPPLTDSDMCKELQDEVAVDSDLQNKDQGTEVGDFKVPDQTTEQSNTESGMENKAKDPEPMSSRRNSLLLRGVVLGRKRPKKDYESLAPFKFFCSMCSFKSKRESHFQKHLAVHKKSVPLLRCNQCSFTTLRLSHLRRHELSHSNQIFACRHCKYKTGQMKLLNRHYRIKHHQTGPVNHNPVIYSCESCDYKTIKRYQYHRHLRCHANLSGDPTEHPIVSSYQCPLCPYKTQRKEHYSRHAANVHSDRRPYLCDLCGKAFKRADALRQHNMVHQDKSNRNARFTCLICTKAFRSQAHLMEHSTMHTNVRAYLCEHCGAAFKTRSVQRKHIQTIHCNPRSHPCSSCDKRFNTKYALQRHLRTHDTPGMRSLVALDSFDKPTQLAETAPGTEVSEDVKDLQPPAEEEVATMETETIAATATIEQTFEQNADGTIRQFPTAYIQTNEATTALLYLTNFQAY